MKKEENTSLSNSNQKTTPGASRGKITVLHDSLICTYFLLNFHLRLWGETGQSDVGFNGHVKNG